MELHVSQDMFAGMQRAALEAEINGGDPALAAWQFTGLPIPQLPTDIPVIVSLSTTGSAKLVEPNPTVSPNP